MTILSEAEKLINGARQEAYGDPATNLNRVAGLWTNYLRLKYAEAEMSITAEDVCWMLADLKKARQMHAHHHDNLVDAAGYIGLIEKINPRRKRR
jgi:hypothetical protein